MKIFTFAVAVLMGLASAFENKEWNVMSIANSASLVSSSMATIGWKYTMDINYSFEYQGGPYTASDAPAAGF
jgi:hypothetical protein